MEVTEEVVTKALRTAIKETNRCLMLNLINAETKNGIIEIRSLFKTWLCREVRKYIDYRTTNAITRDMAITCEGNPAQICGISIHLDQWDLKMMWAKHIQSAFKYFDYEALKYRRPLVVEKTDYCRQDPIINDVKRITVDSINNIKF